MRIWLFVLTLLLSLLPAGRAVDFPDDFSPTFKFTETYNDAVVSDPDFEGEFIVVPRGSLNVQAVASLSGFDTGELDIFSPFAISVGDFSIEGLLGDDPEYDPNDTDHNRSVNIPIDGFDSNGDFVEVGNLSVTWLTPGRVTFAFQVQDATEDWTVAASDYYPNITDPSIDREDLLADLTFGPFSLDLRTVYMIGSASITSDARVVEDLSHVELKGSVDNVNPTVSITQPPPPVGGKTVLTVNESPSGFYTLAGTVADLRAIDGINYPGQVNSVEVRLAPNTSGEGFDFVSADLDGNGNWTLPNAELFLGTNVLTVRAFDVDGNSKEASRQFTYSLAGPVTVTAEAAGYVSPGADDGRLAGTVSGAFMKVGTRKISMVVGQPAPTDTKPGIMAGTLLTVTAKPGVGSVFDGWTGTINGNQSLTAATEVLRFEAKPNLILKARFVPNPFTPAIVGKYHGILTGPDAASRGTVVLTLTKTGAFTGLVKVGSVVLPLKGKVLGSGLWFGTIKKGTKFYDVSFNLNVGQNGDRLIVGSVEGLGVNSDFTADLNSWKKSTNEAGDYDGNYTVLLPPSPGNSDADFPVGMGFGRVTISKLGVVKFIGKLGDGTPVTSSATLVKRPSNGMVYFPLFVSLDKGKGNVSGLVNYDSTQPTSDLTGTLDWTEPVTSGVEPQDFAGQIALHGSVYTKPVGTRVILEASAGAGTLSMVAPLYSKPTNIPPTPLGPANFAGFLTSPTSNPANTFAPQDQLVITKVKLKFNTTTGLYTGTFRDEVLKKTILITGAASQKANTAGGVFIRGNRAGRTALSP